MIYRRAHNDRNRCLTSCFCLSVFYIPIFTPSFRFRYSSCNSLTSCSSFIQRSNRFRHFTPPNGVNSPQSWQIILSCVSGQSNVVQVRLQSIPCILFACRAKAICPPFCLLQFVCNLNLRRQYRQYHQLTDLVASLDMVVFCT